MLTSHHERLIIEEFTADSEEAVHTYNVGFKTPSTKFNIASVTQALDCVGISHIQIFSILKSDFWSILDIEFYGVVSY